MLRDIAAISKISRISDYSPVSKMIAFLLPPLILSFDRNGLASSLVNLGVTLLIIRSLEIPLKIYTRFLKGISFFLILGSIPIILESGYYDGIVLVVRGISSAGSIYMFSATTPVDDLFYCLSRFKPVREVAEIGKSMMRFIITVEDEFKRTKNAMDSRLGFYGWKNRMVNTPKVAGAVFRGILRDWRETEQSLKSRGYAGKTVFLDRDYSPSKNIVLSGTIYNLAIILIAIKT